MAALCDDQEKELTVVALIVTNSLTFSAMQCRSVWTRQSSRAFMDIQVGGMTSGKEIVRISRPTFLYLYNQRVKLQRTHRTRVVIAVETKVAIVLWRLGTNVEYQTISHLFGVGISTACCIAFPAFSAFCNFAVLFRFFFGCCSSSEELLDEGSGACCPEEPGVSCCTEEPGGSCCPEEPGVACCPDEPGVACCPD